MICFCFFSGSSGKIKIKSLDLLIWLEKGVDGTLTYDLTDGVFLLTVFIFSLDNFSLKELET